MTSLGDRGLGQTCNTAGEWRESSTGEGTNLRCRTSPSIGRRRCYIVDKGLHKYSVRPELIKGVEVREEDGHRSGFAPLEDLLELQRLVGEPFALCSSSEGRPEREWREIPRDAKKDIAMERDGERKADGRPKKYLYHIGLDGPPT